MKILSYIYSVSLSLLFWGMSDAVLAQSPNPAGFLQFDVKSHDFGTLEESMKFAYHRFEFKNAGNTPVKINRAESSCGCTVPTWSKDSIGPGETGFIEAKYETTNRIGQFDKTITMYTNSPIQPITYLTIKGNVVKPQEDESQSAQQAAGYIGYDQSNIAFDPLYDNQIASREIRIINNTSYPTTFYDFDPLQLPAFIKIKNFPKTLEPGEFAKFQIEIDGNKALGYGFGGYEITVFSDNAATPYSMIYVSYQRKQFFPKYSARQLKKQPKLFIENPTYDFGKLRAGDIETCEFKFTNTGKKPLEIKQISPDCPCTSVSTTKKIIQPGETIIAKALFDTVTKNGKKSMGVRIVSNDPTEPERYIWLKADFDNNYKIECPTCPK
jgi:hypothetical protein